MAFSVNSYIIGLILVFGLFFGVFASATEKMGSVYGTDDVNISEIDQYNHLDSLESRIKGNAEAVEGVNVESKWYDWFAGLWNKIKSPFVTVTRSYKTLTSVSDLAVDKLELMPIFKQALSTIIVLLVIFGLLAARYFLGRR